MAKSAHRGLRAAALAAAVAILLSGSGVMGCVYLMGASLDSQVAHPAGTHWGYGFRGDDWVGNDASNNPWVCATGTSQTPIDLHPHPTSALAGTPTLRTQWAYEPATSNGSNIQVFNNGHTIQVQWAPGTLNSSVKVPTTGANVLDVLTASNTSADAFTWVAAEPLQFHFHTASEHTVDGHYYPMELHIVHRVAQADLSGCPASGCLTVTGILFKLDEEGKDNPHLEAIWEAMPMREGVVADLKEGATLDIEALLPAEEQRGYLQYSGSLTTPPCTEGLLWHVFATPQTMSLAQLNKYSKAVGLKDCVKKDTAAAAATAQGGVRRMLGAHAYSHDHGHTHDAQPFVRGSLTGFVRLPAEHAAASRALLQDPGHGGDDVTGTPDDWNCTIVSYGFTNRNIQPLNDRTILGYGIDA